MYILSAIKNSINNYFRKSEYIELAKQNSKSSYKQHAIYFNLKQGELVENSKAEFDDKLSKIANAIISAEQELVSANKRFVNAKLYGTSEQRKELKKNIAQLQEKIKKLESFSDANFSNIGDEWINIKKA